MFAKIVKIGTSLLKIKKNITVSFFSNSLTPWCITSEFFG